MTRRKQKPKGLQDTSSTPKITNLSWEIIIKRRFIGYADANWAESKADRKSNSGYLFKYHGSTISWACRGQSCVALSSAEAEYIALSDGCQEMSWLTKLLKDFQEDMELPVKIYEDKSCIKMANNQKFSKRSKYTGWTI